MTDQPGSSGEPVSPVPPVPPVSPVPPRPPVSPGWAPVQPPPAYQPPPGYPPPGGYGPPPGAVPPGYPPPGPAWGAYTQGWAPPPKPGVIPLRPLGVGEILDGAISCLRAEPRTMLGFSALVAVASQLIVVPLTWLLLRDTPAPALDDSATTADDISYAADGIGAAAIAGVVTLIATLLLTGMVTVVVSRAVLGERSDTAQAWRRARPRLPALFGVTVLVFLLLVAAGTLAVLPGVLLALADAPVAAVALAFIVGVPLFAVASIYLYVAFALAPPVVVLERQGVRASLRRSRALVKGAWWRTFGILLLVVVIAQLIAGIVSVPFTVLGLVAGNGSEDTELLPLVISGIGSIVGSAITWPFTAAASALIYVDRRMRREGLDMELTRAAGLAPAGQSATPGAPPTYPGPGG